MTPMEKAIAAGAGVPVFELDRPGGGAHRHRLRVMRVDFPQWGCDGFYVEVSEPGACACVCRVDLGVLVHALMNLAPGEIESAEAREVCDQCGHRHHLDDGVSP